MILCSIPAGVLPAHKGSQMYLKSLRKSLFVDGNKYSVTARNFDEMAERYNWNWG